MRNAGSATPRGNGAVRVFRTVAEIPAGFGPTVAAVGNFDGVHLGHREILEAAAAEARSAGARAVAVTFDPHPEQFLRPAQAPRLLTPLPERLRLLSGTGIDAVLVLAFDAALAGLTAREFVRRILAAALGTRSVHEGQNFRFGHGAAAGVKELAELGAEMGFAVHVHEAVRVRGMEVSSSAVRALVGAGDVRRSRWMLGRPFAVLSPPAAGRGIGTRLVVPTVNLAPYDGLLPAFGVYVTRLKVNGRAFQAVTNVGNRPTFGEASFAVESHILDFDPVVHPTDKDLSVGAPVELDEQTPIELEFLLRLRGEREWPSAEALKEQIFKDVARAQRYFRLLRSH
jgi:riboflavin kinase/FMN adenylyltransferase